MSVKHNQLIHGTAVSIDGYGVLLTGLSGSGKSDLALRLIDRGSKLISDDQVELKFSKEIISMTPPPSIAGKMEIHGLGIWVFDYLEDVPLKLVVELEKKVDRFPMDRQQKSIIGVPVPLIKIVSNQPSAPIKVEMVMRRLLQLENQSD